MLGSLTPWASMTEWAVGCSFTGVRGIAISVSPDGTRMVCNTTQTPASDRQLQVSLNLQDFEAVADFRF